jgi:transposase
LSVPGLGPILAAVIASEIDEPRRFADAGHVCAYAGLVPGTHAIRSVSATRGRNPRAAATTRD